MHAAPPPTKRVPRTAIRLAVPSKGRMAEDTLQLLKVRRCLPGHAADRSSTEVQAMRWATRHGVQL